MKKVIFLFAFLVIFSGITHGQDDIIDVYGGVSYNEYEFEYHNNLVDNYDISVNPNDPNAEFKRRDKIDGGVGYYVGVRGWLFDNWALGLEIEELEADANRLYIHDEPAAPSEDHDIDIMDVRNFKANTNGMLLTATYDFPYEVTDSATYFLFGVGVYDSEFDYISFDHTSNNSPPVKINTNNKTYGFKLGLKNNYYINNNLTLMGRIMYRYANIDAEFGEKLYEEDLVTKKVSQAMNHNIIDYSGLEVSLGVELKF